MYLEPAQETDRPSSGVPQCVLFFQSVFTKSFHAFSPSIKCVVEVPPLEITVPTLSVTFVHPPLALPRLPLLTTDVKKTCRQNSMPGRSDTTALPLLDRQQTNLLEALPPVVTGVDVDDVFEGWQRSSLQTKDPTRRGMGEHDSVGYPGNNDQERGTAADHPRDGGGPDVMAEVGLPSAHNAVAAEGVVETRLPAVTGELDGGLSDEIPLTHSSVEEEGITARRAAAAAAAETTIGVEMESIRSDGALDTPAAAKPQKAEDGGAAAAAEDAAYAAPGHLEAYTLPSGVGLTRLCRRGVILLTRSPACPDLVAWQTHPAEQRTYDQMEPLLTRANMTHKDLHPALVGFLKTLAGSVQQ